MDILAHQEKSLFNSSERATFPARFADTVVSKQVDDRLIGLAFPAR
jgi:hypothetical protein